MDLIRAIKDLRALPVVINDEGTGGMKGYIGLKDAKEYVERISAEVRAETPKEARSKFDVIDAASALNSNADQILQRILETRMSADFNVSDSAELFLAVQKARKALMDIGKVLGRIDTRWP